MALLIPPAGCADPGAWVRGQLNAAAEHVAAGDCATVQPFLLALLGTAEPVYCRDVCDVAVHNYNMAASAERGPTPGPVEEAWAK